MSDCAQRPYCAELEHDLREAWLKAEAEVQSLREQLKQSKKTILICGGGDWADASANLLTVDASVDIEAIKREQQKYYNETYLPSYREFERTRDRSALKPYYNLVEYLIAFHGASTETNVEEVWL